MKKGKLRKPTMLKIYLDLLGIQGGTLLTESGPEVVKQGQREVELGEDGLPRRDTGRVTGTAKTPTGPKDRLTEEERKKRHKRMVEQGRTK